MNGNQITIDAKEVLVLDSSTFIIYDDMVMKQDITEIALRRTRLLSDT